MNEAIAGFSAKAYIFLLPVSWIGIAIVIVFLLPLAIFRTTRSFAGSGIFYASYVFGMTTWFLGATVTFATWGWLGFIIGILFVGVGVVPIGILAAFISLGEPSLGITLIVLSIVTYSSRVGGIALTDQ